MTAVLDGGEWSAARPGRTLPPGKTRYPFYRRLGGPQGRSGRAENLVCNIRTARISFYGIHEWIYAQMCLKDQEITMVQIDEPKRHAYINFETMDECRTSSIRPDDKYNIDIPMVNYQQSG